MPREKYPYLASKIAAGLLSEIDDKFLRLQDLEENEHPYSWDFCSCGCGEHIDECNEDLSVKPKKPTN